MRAIGSAYEPRFSVRLPIPQIISAFISLNMSHVIVYSSLKLRCVTDRSRGVSPRLSDVYFVTPDQSLREMDGVWKLRSVSKFVTTDSLWEMGPHRYSGFIRYNVAGGLVSVCFSPYDKVNHLTIFTGRSSQGLISFVKVDDSPLFHLSTL